MSTIGNEISNIKHKIVKNKFLIVAIILLVILFIIFIVHLYFNIRARYLSPNSNFLKLYDGKENLFYKRMKYIIILALFLMGLTFLYIFNPYNIINNYFGVVILLSIFIGTVIVSMLSWYNYAYKKESIVNNENSKTPPPVNYFTKALLFILFGGISGLIIYLLVFLISPSSSHNSLISFILNLLIVIFILMIVYKVFSNGNNNFFTFIMNILLFIPKSLLHVFEFVVKYGTSEYNSTTTSSILLLLITMIFMYIYFKLPSLEKKINVQGGKQLINMPINTNSLSVLSSYEDLNGSDKFKYQYAISFWVFINSYPPKINTAHDNYVSLLNYGDKPNVLYNIGKNTLMVTMKKNDKDIDVNNLSEIDSNGNRIIYKKDNFLLQKWNNIIINFTGGTLDIFLNGELVKSRDGVVPYMKLDSLTVGTEKGIGGGICNLVYFDKSLTSSNIYYIYNTVKNKTPPVPVNDNMTVKKILS